MVRNLVFDMGNVLVFYDSRRASRRFAQDEAEMEAVNTSVFVSPEWLMLDMGVISQEEALRRMQARLPEGHAREAARRRKSTTGPVRPFVGLDRRKTAAMKAQWMPACL